MRPSCGRRFSAMLRWLKILTRETMAGWKRFQLRGHGNFLQFAVNAVADAKFVLERFEVDVRGAQLNRVLQNLVDEADDGRLVFGGFIEVGVLGVFINDLEAFFLVERADGVRADAETLFDFALDASLVARTGLRFKPVIVFSASRPCVANSRLVATSTVPLSRRNGSNSSFSKIRAGNSESNWRSGSTSSNDVNTRPYSCASQRRISSSLEDSCRDATMRSSNGFGSLAGVSVIFCDSIFTAINRAAWPAPPV
jgi:hypothetical protein